MARIYNEFEKLNTIKNVQKNEMDVNDSERLDELENKQLDDAEGMDIAGLGENYANGVYYQEDIDKDFRYDD